VQPESVGVVVKQVQHDPEKGPTILFENLGSSEFIERLSEENVFTISKNEDSEALNARSTRL
jgi:hypothetical protein